MGGAAPVVPTRLETARPRAVLYGECNISSPERARPAPEASPRGNRAACEGRLENKQKFPRLTAPRVDGGVMTLPDDLAGGCPVLLFYRGHG